MTVRTADGYRPTLRRRTPAWPVRLPDHRLELAEGQDLHLAAGRLSGNVHGFPGSERIRDALSGRARRGLDDFNLEQSGKCEHPHRLLRDMSLDQRRQCLEDSPHVLLGQRRAGSQFGQYCTFAHRLVELHRLLCHHILPFAPKEIGTIYPCFPPACNLTRRRGGKAARPASTAVNRRARVPPGRIAHNSLIHWRKCQSARGQNRFAPLTLVEAWWLG